MYEHDAQERPGGSDDGANGSAGDPRESSVNKLTRASKTTYIGICILVYGTYRSILSAQERPGGSDDGANGTAGDPRESSVYGRIRSELISKADPPPVLYPVDAPICPPSVLP